MVRARVIGSCVVEVYNELKFRLKSSIMARIKYELVLGLGFRLIWG